MSGRRRRLLAAMEIEVPRLRVAYSSAESSDAESPSAPVVPTKPSPISNLSPELKAAPSAAPIKTLDQLRAEAQACTRCALSATRQNVVFGSGCTHPDWLILGEAPGAEEDRQGVPFVGRSGQLLEAMLFALDLKRDQVYIANIIKCRPPQNRDPREEEIKTCLPWLEQQIDRLNPRLILTLGRIAAQTLLQSTVPVGRLRGRVYQFRERPLVVSYHPAYLLRRPTEKARAWQDLRLARSCLA